MQGEEFAGAPLMCQADGVWHLVGVSAWRKGCAKLGQRPRIYDKVAANSGWARKTMTELSSYEANRSRIPKSEDGSEADGNQDQEAPEQEAEVAVAAGRLKRS